MCDQSNETNSASVIGLETAVSINNKKNLVVRDANIGGGFVLLHLAWDHNELDQLVGLDFTVARIAVKEQD